MSDRRTLREALAIWGLDGVQLRMAAKYYCVAYRLAATQLQAAIVALREARVSWKLIAHGLLNTQRSCHRRRRDLIESLGIDEMELSQILRGDRPAPVRSHRRRTPQERPFRRPDLLDNERTVPVVTGGPPL